MRKPRIRDINKLPPDYSEMGLEQRRFDSELIFFTSQITQSSLQTDLTAEQNHRSFWVNLYGPGRDIDIVRQKSFWAICYHTGQTCVLLWGWI